MKNAMNRIESPAQAKSGLRVLSDREVEAVSDGFLLPIIGIIFPMKHAKDRTQGDVNNISDIAAA